MKSPLQVLPAYPANASVAKQLPSWPAASIILLLVLAALFPPGLLTGMNSYLLLLALIVWFFSREPFDRNLLLAVAPFGLIIIIGLVVGAGAGSYLYFKDAWYISNPAVIISVGYVLYRCMPDLTLGFRAFVLAGTLLSLMHLSAFALHPDVLSLNSAALRQVIGTGYYAPALAFIILFACRGNWPGALKLPRWLAFICLAICLLDIGASFSRTMLMVSVFGVLASIGFFARRECIRIGVAVALGLLVIGTLRIGIDIDSREANTSFIGKLARATDELTIREYTDIQSINENWRGYETFMALKYYSSGSPVELLLGQGFGAQVDLGLFMPLAIGPGGEPVRMKYIPVLHNGYAYLLVKGGAVAIALFCFTLAWLYRVGRRGATGSVGEIRTAAARVLQAIMVSIAFTTWVVSGAFNKLDMFPFLMAAGFLLAALTRNAEGRV